MEVFLYTIEDLNQAKEELDSWNRRWENYSGNNPNKYQSDIRMARSKVQMITDYLKRTGILEMNPKEILDAELDRTFPNAQSKEIVEYKGDKYQRWFFPLERSHSRKTVTVWGKEWIKM
jgi:hypothetical protein